MRPIRSFLLLVRVWAYEQLITNDMFERFGTEIFLRLKKYHNSKVFDEHWRNSHEFTNLGQSLLIPSQIIDWEHYAVVKQFLSVIDKNKASSYEKKKASSYLDLANIIAKMFVIIMDATSFCVSQVFVDCC